MLWRFFLSHLSIFSLESAKVHDVIFVGCSRGGGVDEIV